MSLVLNLEGAKQQVTTQLTNKDLIDALNKYGEEYFKTIGIIFYTRYLYYLRRDNKEADREIIELIQNYFSEPTFDSWMRLANQCCEQLCLFGDALALDYIKLREKRLEESENQRGKKILKEIHRLKGNPKIDPPAHITYGDLGDKFMILLRNFYAHDWSDAGTLQPLVELGIKEFMLHHIDELLQPFTLEILIPKLFDPNKSPKTHVKFYSIQNNHIDVITLPVESNQVFSFEQIYFRFDIHGNPFECPSNLVLFNENERRVYTYTKSKKNGEAIYTNVPLVGNIGINSKKFKGIHEVFDLSQTALQQENIKSTLRDKFGPIVEERGIINNLQPLAKTYIPRPELEKKLIDALKLQRSYIFTIDGGGGYGKTELVKKVAWDIIHKEIPDDLKERLQFGYVFWISGKSTFFVRGEIEEKVPTLGRLEDLLDCVFYVTDKLQYLTTDLAQKKKACIEILNGLGSFLLIIDNLETVSDIEQVSDYLGIEFDSINRNCSFKIIITSRVSKIEGERRVNVTTMTSDETQQLIIEELQRWDILEKFNSKEHLDEITRLSGRIPLLVIHIVSLLRNRTNLEEFKKHMPRTMEKAFGFICEFQWNELLPDAQKLAKAIALNGGRINFGLAKMVCDFEDDTLFQDARIQLQESAFLIDSDLNINVLAMLPPIYEFSFGKLRQTPTVEHELNEKLKLMKSVLESKKPTTLITTDPQKTRISDDIDLQNLLLFASDRVRIRAHKDAYDFYKLAVKNYPASVDAWREKAEFEFKYLENDEIARQSFEKAIELNPKDPVTYQNYAYWEFDRGAKTGEIAFLKKAIDLNTRAKEFLKDPAAIRVTNDHIVSAYMKLVYIEKNLAQSNPADKYYHFSLAENYVKMIISILETNFVQEPKTPDEIHHNVIDYNLLANAYLNNKGGNDKNRKYYDYQALLNIVRGLKLARENVDLRRKLDFWQIQKILENYSIRWTRLDEKTIANIIKHEPKISDDLDRMKIF